MLLGHIAWSLPGVFQPNPRIIHGVLVCCAVLWCSVLFCSSLFVCLFFSVLCCSPLRLAWEAKRTNSRGSWPWNLKSVKSHLLDVKSTAHLKSQFLALKFIADLWGYTVGGPCLICKFQSFWQCSCRFDFSCHKRHMHTYLYVLYTGTCTWADKKVTTEVQCDHLRW